MNRVIQKDDCEIIEVENTLKAKVAITGSGPVDRTAIQRAETALKHLSVQFDDWLAEEVKSLTAARDAVRQNGLAGDYFDELFRTSHAIMGQAETLGYPIATQIAASLCRLLDAPEDKSRVPLALVDNHVDALWRIMQDQIKDPDDEIARAVAERLMDVVFEFVDREEQKKRAKDQDGA
ncbi:MAG: Hpt domain-containing protein [Hyphomicrobiales bacterium]